MPYRKTVLATGEIYHVLNRGIAQAPIFLSKRDYLRFLSLISFYRFFSPSLSYSHYERLPVEARKEFFEDMEKRHPKLVDIYAYCLMPNHFHLLLKQIFDKAISIMLSNLQNSYAKYFDLKNKRQGALFQSMFKAVLIETDEQFLHVSRYIHLNPNTAFLIEIEKLSSYTWSSFPEYLNARPTSFVTTREILDMLDGSNRCEKYRRFVFDQAEYQQKLGRIKHLCLENP